MDAQSSHMNPDYTWLRCGVRYHAFSRSTLKHFRKSLCGQASTDLRDGLNAPTDTACSNCLRAIKRTEVAAKAKRTVPVEVRVDPSAAPADAPLIPPPGMRVRLRAALASTLNGR